MMTQSLPGLLNKVASHLDAHDEESGLSSCIRQLLLNLRELRERKAEGEKVLDEFFAIYTGWGK